MADDDNDQRFWLMDVDGPTQPGELVAIVDEEEGGIVAYACSTAHADRLLRLLRIEAEIKNG